MGYDYGYYGGEELLEELLPLASVLGAAVLAGAAIGLLVRAVIYVVRSLALYTVASRRGLKNAWLSWVPVGTEWIIGSVSDQYKYLTQGKNQNRRKILLALKGVGVLLKAAGSVLAVVYVGQVMSMVEHNQMIVGASQLMMPLTGSMLLGVASAGVGIAAYVFRQMSMYDLYRSCDPKNAVPFLVFGILFGILEPVFLMIVRKKDEGMPPRKTASEEPVNEYL